jgi:hypothetical protein
MDPSSNLEEQLELAGRLLDGIGCHEYEDLAQYEADVDRLCELVVALDGWISKGGFLPKRWRK